jgi:hypothetical protein
MPDVALAVMRIYSQHFQELKRSTNGQYGQDAGRNKQMHEIRESAHALATALGSKGIEISAEFMRLENMLH